MELKPNMYVRTKKGIFQITNDKTFIENKIEYIAVNGRYTCIDVNAIIKASNNIIDLIEVGDYVNGGQVREKKEDYIRISGGNFMFQYLKENEIKSIVTKEQFEVIKYEVKMSPMQNSNRGR